MGYKLGVTFRYSLMTILEHCHRDTWALKTMLSSIWSLRTWNTDDEDGVQMSPLRPRNGLSPSAVIPLQGRVGRSDEIHSQSVLWGPSQVYFALVDSSFRRDSHKVDGHSYALHPIQQQCRQRTTKSPWITVKRGGLLLGSAKGLFTSARILTAYSWRWLHSKALHIPHIKTAGPPPPACQDAGSPLPPSMTDGGKPLTALCKGRARLK